MHARPGEALLYTINAVVTVAPLMAERPLPYNPDIDLVPVHPGATDFLGLTIPDALPVRSLAEFAARARAQPGALNWYASGLGYLAFRNFMRAAGGLDMAYVAYRGSPPALLDLAAGRIQAVLTPLGAAMPLLREGRLRLLAVTNPMRSPVARKPRPPPRLASRRCRWKERTGYSAGVGCPRRRGPGWRLRWRKRWPSPLRRSVARRRHGAARRHHALGLRVGTHQNPCALGRAGTGFRSQTAGLNAHGMLAGNRRAGWMRDRDHHPPEGRSGAIRNSPCSRGARASGWRTGSNAVAGPPRGGAHSKRAEGRGPWTTAPQPLLTPLRHSAGSAWRCAFPARCTRRPRLTSPASSRTGRATAPLWLLPQVPTPGPCAA